MPEFQQLFKPRSEGWFEWQTRLPLFRDARVRYDLNPDCCSILDVDEFSGNISVVALCESQPSVNDAQERSWDFISSNSEQIESALRRKLWPLCYGNYQTFISHVCPNDKNWLEIRDAEEWDDQSSLDSQIELIAINLLEDGLDEIGYSLFDFAVGWDDEHGVSVLMHRENVLAASGLSDFTNRGDTLLDHVRSIQEYDWSPGDLRLDR